MSPFGGFNWRFLNTQASYGRLFSVRQPTLYRAKGLILNKKMIYLINNHLMKIQTDNPHVVASALVELSDRFGGKWPSCYRQKAATLSHREIQNQLGKRREAMEQDEFEDGREICRNRDSLFKLLVAEEF